MSGVSERFTFQFSESRPGPPAPYLGTDHPRGTISHARPFRGAPIIEGEELISQAESIFDGQTINWDSTEAPMQFAAQICSPKSKFSIVFANSLERSSLEGEEALGIFLRQTEEIDIDNNWIKSDRFRRDFIVLRMGCVAIAMGEISKLYGLEPSNNAEKLADTVVDRLYDLIQVVRHLKKSDLELFIAYEDLSFQISETLMMQTAKSTLFNKPKPPRSDRIPDKIREVSYSTWDRLRVGWDENDMYKVVSALPDIKSAQILAHAALALEDNLLSGNPINLDAGKIDPKGAASLLKLEVWGVNKGYRIGDYINVHNNLDVPFAPTDLTIPRKYIPSSTALELLRQVSMTNESSFNNLLHKLAEIEKDEKEEQNWLATLINLRILDKGLRGVNALLEAMPFQDPAAVVLDKKPGGLYLNFKGGIRVVEDPEKPHTGFPLYTSSLQPEPLGVEASPAPAKKAEEEKSKSKYKIESILNDPLLGEVAIVKESEISPLLDELFSWYVSSSEEDRVLTDFLELQAKFESNPDTKPIFTYMPKLNENDKIIKDVSRLDLEALLVDDNRITFVVNRKKLNEDNNPIAFQGILSSNGTLNIEGMDPSFIGDYKQLVLNNLALSLKDTEYYEKGSLEFSENKAQIHEAVERWNRFDRGNLLRISPDSQEASILSTLDNGIKVLLGIEN